MNRRARRAQAAQARPQTKRTLRAVNEVQDLAKKVFQTERPDVRCGRTGKTVILSIEADGTTYLQVTAASLDEGLEVMRQKLLDALRPQTMEQAVHENTVVQTFGASR